MSYGNHFALLKVIGYDCAGAISFHEIEDEIYSQSTFPLEGEILSDTTLYQHIKALPKKPLFSGFEGLRLSLAGVHDKAAVCLINGEIALPKNGCPTTHILKPAVPQFEGIVENEYFCLQTAKAIGLPIPPVEVRHLKDISYLLIERYDRKIEKNQVARIPQEDFCQALGIVTTRKYQNEGGPGFQECFKLLTKLLQPAISRNTLTAVLIFNFLIGNMDAHGKNFSLLHLNTSPFMLAPFYDLVCTRAYSEHTENMAMKIGSKYDANQVLPRHWEQLCREINYSYPAMKQLIKKQGAAIIKFVESTSISSLIINQLKTLFIKRITHTLNLFEKDVV